MNYIFIYHKKKIKMSKSKYILRKKKYQVGYTDLKMSRESTNYSIACVIISFSLVIMGLNLFISLNLNLMHQTSNIDLILKPSYTWAVRGFILDDTGGGDYTWEQVALEDWCSGSGEKDNPYILEDIYFGGDPLWIQNSEAYFIIRQCLMESYGFAFSNTKNGVFYDNIIEVRVNPALSITDSSNILVEGNDITNLGVSGWTGIRIGTCTNNTIKNNNIHDGFSIGIFLSGWYGIECNSNYLINNTITSSSSGIVLYDCFDNIVKENHLVQNSIGIIVENGAYNNRIVGNNISSNNKGVEITTSANNNEFYWNNITQNSLEGVYIDDTANGNLFFENRFELNSINSFDNNSQNYWNNSEIGNYWDDYTGVDMNDDGIGDTPYDLPPAGGSVDHYPIWEDGDNMPPYIQILSPYSSEVFGIEAPEFEIIISDASPINTTWYTMNDGSDNYTFTELTGTINQTAWDSNEYETITLIFYANDSLGNVDSQSVTIWKDLIKPIIIINAPTSNQLCGIIAPLFSLTINEPNLQKKWYNLNGGNNITFTVQNQISQSEWDNFGNGTVLICFYAEDIIGNMDYSQIFVRKDTLEPEVTINSPIAAQKFGFTPPQFNLSISETTSITSWYQIEGDATQYEFIGLTGTLDEDLWNGVPEGQVSIIFYARDEAGNIGSAMVNVVKDLPEEQAIGGYQIILIFIIFGLTVIILARKVRSPHL